MKQSKNRCISANVFLKAHQHRKSQLPTCSSGDGVCWSCAVISLCIFGVRWGRDCWCCGFAAIYWCRCHTAFCCTGSIWQRSSESCSQEESCVQHKRFLKLTYTACLKLCTFDFLCSPSLTSCARGVVVRTAIPKRHTGLATVTPPGTAVDLHSLEHTQHSKKMNAVQNYN